MKKLVNLKLISLQVLEAKNVICGIVIPDKDKEEGMQFLQMTHTDDCQRAFMVPSHIVVGLFEDGTVKAAGIRDLNDLNEYGQNTDRESMDDIFNYYDDFVYYIDIDAAKAIVRWYLYDGAYGDTEKEIKDNIYKEFLKSGITITEEAVEYLTS